MARTFVAASSQYLENAAAVSSTLPLSMSCWFNQTSSANQAIVGLFDNTNLQRRLEVIIVSDKIRVGHNDGTTNATADSTATLSTGVWNQGGGIFTGTASRTAVLNGVLGTAGTTSVTGSMSGLNRTAVARRSSSSPGLYFGGSVAEFGIWSVALAQADWTALAAGVCPLLVRPDVLLFYAPLIGQYSPEVEPRGRFDLTLGNTPTSAAHPRQFYPSDQQIKTHSAGGGTQTATPGVATVTLTGVAPAATPQGVASCTPGAGTVTLTGIAPAASGTGTGIATPGAATATVTGVAPAASGTGTGTATPDVAVVTITGTSPAASGSGSITGTPGAAAVTITGVDAAGTPTTYTAAPGAATVTLTGASPAASGTGTATATPGAALVDVTGAAVPASGGLAGLVVGWMRTLALRWRKLRNRHGRRSG